MNEETSTSDFPDRLSVDPNSRYYDEAILARHVGIRLNGVEFHNVEEYCISQGWIRTTIGNTVDRRGKPLPKRRRSNQCFPQSTGRSVTF